MISREEALENIVEMLIPDIDANDTLEPAAIVVKPVVDYVGKTKKFIKKPKPNSKVCHKPLLVHSSQKLLPLSPKMDREIQEEVSEFYSHRIPPIIASSNILILPRPKAILAL